jgi:hypothetical protein
MRRWPNVLRAILTEGDADQQASAYAIFFNVMLDKQEKEGEETFSIQTKRLWLLAGASNIGSGVHLYVRWPESGYFPETF